MARKGVLATDPSVLQMTPVHWYFEFAAARRYENNTLEFLGKMAKAMIVNILGLNQLRPTHADGRVKLASEMTDEDREAFMPLVNWIAHPEILTKVSEQFKEEEAVNQAQSDMEYEALVAAIDAADGDMEPILGIDPVKEEERAKERERLDKEKEKLLIPDRRDIKVDI